jgi:hypothetical protein
MIYIAHRGNIHGPNPQKENHPDYISSALEKGFSAEIDVWVINHEIYLGHDSPTYNATQYFINFGPWHIYNHKRLDDSPGLWIHCKNFNALKYNFNGHYFAHDQDDYTLTSSGYIWTFPRALPLGETSIAVMPEKVPNWALSGAYGICSDYVAEYKNDIYFQI